MDIVSPIKTYGKQLGKHTLTAVQDSFSSYTSNLQSLKSDAEDIKDTLVKGGKTSTEIFKNLQTNGMKQFKDWFFEAENDFAEYDLNGNDDDFDPGFEIDAGLDDEEEDKTQVLDERAMKDITRGQVNAMYKIGGKQVEAATMNTAEIISAVNTRSSEIVASVNQVNTTLTNISKQIEHLTKISPYYTEEEKRKRDDSILDYDGGLSLGGMMKLVKQETSMFTDMFDMVKSFGEMGAFSPSMLIGLALDPLKNKKIKSLGDKSIDDIGNEFNRLIGNKIDDAFTSILTWDKLNSFLDLNRDSTLRTNFTSVVKNEYTRDAAKFDGITRQTIVEIIPEYLKRINENLSGEHLEINERGHLTTKKVDTWSSGMRIAFSDTGFESSTMDSMVKEHDSYLKRHNYDRYTMSNAAKQLMGAVVTDMMINGRRTLGDVRKDPEWWNKMKMMALSTLQQLNPSTDWEYILELIIYRLLNDPTARTEFDKRARSLTQRMARDLKTKAENTTRKQDVGIVSWEKMQEQALIDLPRNQEREIIEDEYKTAMKKVDEKSKLTKIFDLKQDKDIILEREKIKKEKEAKIKAWEEKYYDPGLSSDIERDPSKSVLSKINAILGGSDSNRTQESILHWVKNTHWKVNDIFELLNRGINVRMTGRKKYDVFAHWKPTEPPDSNDDSTDKSEERPHGLRLSMQHFAQSKTVDNVVNQVRDLMDIHDENVNTSSTNTTNMNAVNTQREGESHAEQSTESSDESSDGEPPDQSVEKSLKQYVGNIVKNTIPSVVKDAFGDVKDAFTQSDVFSTATEAFKESDAFNKVVDFVDSTGISDTASRIKKLINYKITGVYDEGKSEIVRSTADEVGLQPMGKTNIIGAKALDVDDETIIAHQVANDIGLQPIGQSDIVGEKALNTDIDDLNKIDVSEADEEDRQLFDLIRTELQIAITDGDGKEDLQSIMQKVGRIKNDKLRSMLTNSVRSILERNGASTDNDDSSTPVEKRSGILGGIASLLLGKASTIFGPITSLLSPLLMIVRTVGAPVLKIATWGIRSGIKDIKEGFTQLRESTVSDVKHATGLLTDKLKDKISKKLDQMEEKARARDESEQREDDQTNQVLDGLRSKVDAIGQQIQTFKQSTSSGGKSGGSGQALKAIAGIAATVMTGGAAAPAVAGATAGTEATVAGMTAAQAANATGLAPMGPTGASTPIGAEALNTGESIANAGIMEGLNGIMDVAGKILEYFPGFMQSLAGLGKIAAGVTKIGANIAAGLTAITAFREFFDKTIQKSVKNLNRALKSIFKTFKPIVKSIGKAFKNVFDAVARPVKALSESLKPVIEHLTPVLDDLLKMTEPLTEVFEDLLDSIVDIIVPSFTLLEPILKVFTTLFVKPAVDKFTMMLNDIAELVTFSTQGITLLAKIVEQTRNLGKHAETAANVGLKAAGIFSPMLRMFGNVGTITKTVGNVHKFISTDIPKTMNNLPNIIWTALKKFGTDVKNSIAKTFDKVKSAVVTFIKDIARETGFTKVVSTVSDVITNIGEKVDKVHEIIRYVVLKIVAPIMAAKETVTGAINWVKEKATEAFNTAVNFVTGNSSDEGTSSDGHGGSGYQRGDSPYDSNVTSTGSIMDGIVGSGNPYNQHSYGNYLNMSERGCGPVALTEALTRRGVSANVANIAASMASSGAYNPSRGTSVGGFINTANAAGMGLRAGGVTSQSLKYASPTNPVTLIGSGGDYGTRYGNNHYVNVIGTDRSGMAYVSNPLTGKVERRTTTGLARSSMLGLYGSGDLADAFEMPDNVQDKLGELKSLASQLLNIFKFDTDDFSDEYDAAIGEKNTETAERAMNENLSDEEYSTYSAQARAQFEQENPKRDGESDEEYEARWQKSRVAYMMRLVGDIVAGRASAASTSTITGSSTSSGGSVASQLPAVVKAYEAIGITGAKGSYDQSGSTRTLTINGQTYKERPDCTGLVDAVIDSMGYNSQGMNSASFQSAKGIKDKSGNYSADWQFIDKPSLSEFKLGDIGIRYGDGSGNHHGEIIAGVQNGTAYGWNFGGDKPIARTIKVVDNQLAGMEPMEAAMSAGAALSSVYTRLLRYVAQNINTTTTSGGSLQNATDKEKVWYYLTNNMGFTKEAAAGVMGNMKHESGIRANNLQDSYNKSLGYSDEGYTSAVDSGQYSESRFVSDSAGYGLVQFTSKENKRNLYNKKKELNTSIADVSMQLSALNDYLSAHHSRLLNTLRSTTDITTAVKDFMNDYERPGVPALQSRINGANAIYKEFANWTPSANQIVQSSYSTAGSISTGITQTDTTTSRPSSAAGFTNSALVDYDEIARYGSKSYSRSGKPTKITWHIQAGSNSKKGFENCMDQPGRSMSASYAIDKDGKITQYVDESRGPWTSNSESNDKQAVTFEISNVAGVSDAHPIPSGYTEKYPISDLNMQRAIDLTVDIAKRNGISQFNYTGDSSGNWTYHRMFNSGKSCPGEYIVNHTSEILNTINSRLNGSYVPTTIAYDNSYDTSTYYDDMDYDYSDYDTDTSTIVTTPTTTTTQTSSGGIPSLGIPENAFVKGDGDNAISKTDASSVFKPYGGKRYGLSSNAPQYNSKYDISTNALNKAFRKLTTASRASSTAPSNLIKNLNGKDSTYLKSLSFYNKAKAKFDDFKQFGRIPGQMNLNKSTFIQDVRSHPSAYENGSIRQAIVRGTYNGKKYKNDTDLFKALYGSGDLGYIDPYAGNIYGYGDDTTSTIISNNDIPPIDYSKFTQMYQTSDTPSTTYQQYVITSTDGSVDQERLHAILTNTYNVRAERVEELLEEISNKLDDMKPQPQPRSNTSTDMASNMFSDNTIPTAVDRISR